MAKWLMPNMCQWLHLCQICNRFTRVRTPEVARFFYTFEEILRCLKSYNVLETLLFNTAKSFDLVRLEVNEKFRVKNFVSSISKTETERN